MMIIIIIIIINHDDDDDDVYFNNNYYDYDDDDGNLFTWKDSLYTENLVFIISIKIHAMMIIPLFW